EEAVLLDRSQRGQAAGDLVQVETEPVAPPYLHRVAATERRGVRSESPFEVGELPPRATGAVRVARRQIDEILPSVPDIEDGHLAAHPLQPAGQDLERLRRLQRGDDADDRPQDPGGVAGRGGAGRGSALEHVAQTGGIAL